MDDKLMAKVADKIEALIDPVIVDMGYELVGIEYVASPNVNMHKGAINMTDFQSRR